MAIRKSSRKSILNKNTIMLFISLVLAAIGVFYSKTYIENQVNYYRAQLNKTEPMVKIVVPKRKMVRGEVVTTDDISLRELPTKYADTNSINGANYEVAVGQRLSFDVDQGRPLLWAHLEGGRAPTFSGKVPAGLRAMTVRVDEINSISGFLQPKDRIDLLLSYGSGDRNQIFPLIQNLDVIATGIQTLVDKTAQGGKRSFTTITVKVSPEEAKKITLSQQVGKLTAMLRNPDDEAPLSTTPMSVAQLLNKPPPVVKKKPKIKPVLKKKKEKGIEYIIGGS